MIKLVQRDLLSCEAIVRRAPNGELLMVCQCGDVTEPAPGNRVYVWHSKDDGSSWSKRELLAPEDGRAVYQTEVSVTDGEIRAYLTFHDGRFNKYEHRVYVSYDSGYTWADKCGLPLDGFCFIRGMLREGNRQILPYQLYDVPKDVSEKLSLEKKYIWDAGLDFVRSGTLVSDDGGNTYRRSEREVLLPLKDVDGKLKFVWSEPSVIRLSDGRLAMLLRYDYTGKLYSSYSCDDGVTWSEAKPTDIPNPSNKVKLLSTGDGGIALIHTPDPVHGMSHRTPLELWISYDDMKTWQVKKTLWDIDGWISYPDGFIEGDTGYFSVELNRHDVYFIKTKIPKSSL